jgi:hypothetical protein
MIVARLRATLGVSSARGPGTTSGARSKAAGIRSAGFRGHVRYASGTKTRSVCAKSRPRQSKGWSANLATA